MLSSYDMVSERGHSPKGIRKDASIITRPETKSKKGYNAEVGHDNGAALSNSFLEMSLSSTNSKNAEPSKFFKAYLGFQQGKKKAGTHKEKKSLLIDCGKAPTGGPTAAIITLSTRIPSTKSLVYPYHPQFFPTSDRRIPGITNHSVLFK